MAADKKCPEAVSDIDCVLRLLRRRGLRSALWPEQRQKLRAHVRSLTDLLGSDGTLASYAGGIGSEQRHKLDAIRDKVD